MQVNVTLHLVVTEEGVQSRVELNSYSPPGLATGSSSFVSPALAAEAASVTQEVVEFAEYIAHTTGEAS